MTYPQSGLVSALSGRLICLIFPPGSAFAKISLVFIAPQCFLISPFGLRYSILNGLLSVFECSSDFRIFAQICLHMGVSEFEYLKIISYSSPILIFERASLNMLSSQLQSHVIFVHSMRYSSVTGRTHIFVLYFSSLLNEGIDAKESAS